MAPILCERCSSSTSFPDGVFGFPLKSRYSGGVWGGEGTQGNRMSVTGTPGRWALRGRGGAILVASRVPPGWSRRRRVVGFSRMTASEWTGRSSVSDQRPGDVICMSGMSPQSCRSLAALVSRVCSNNGHSHFLEYLTVVLLQKYSNKS